MTKIQEKSKFKLDRIRKTSGTLAKLIEQLSNAQKITYDHSLHEILSISSTLASGLYVAEYEGRKYLCNEYYLLVAESGERKTWTQNYLLGDLRKRHQEHRRKYKIENEKYKEQKVLYDNAIKKHGIDQMRVTKPQRPIDTNIMIGSDCTKEGLIIELGENKSKLKLLSSDDAKDFFDAIGMQDSGRGRMMTALNKLWSNSDVEETKVKHEGTISIDGSKALMNINFSMQSDVFYRNLCDTTTKEIGFTARYLMTKSERLAGYRNEIFGLDNVPEGHKYYNASSPPVEEIERFIKLLPKTLDNIINEVKNNKGDFQHTTKRFEIGALKLLKDIEMKLEDSQGENQENEYYKELASKSFQHLINICVAIDWIAGIGASAAVGASAISRDTVWTAYIINQYYIDQHKGMIHIEDKQAEDMSKGAAKFKKWIDKKREEGIEYIPWRNVVQCCKIIRNSSDKVRNEIIYEMVELKYIQDYRGTPNNPAPPIEAEVIEKDKKGNKKAVDRLLNSYIKIMKAENGAVTTTKADSPTSEFNATELLKRADEIVEKYGDIDPNDDKYWELIKSGEIKPIVIKRDGKYV